MSSDCRTRLGAMVVVVAGLLVMWGLATIGASAARADAPSANAVPQRVQATVARVMSKPVYRHSSWGIAVRDARTGQRLYGVNPEQMLVPGSLLKIYSTSAALRAYGPNYRFHTPVYRDGRVTRGVLHGNLDLVASGDFSMGLRERRNGTMAFTNFPTCDHNYADVADTCGLVGRDPLKGVETLAARVRQAGIRRVTGNVIIDDRLFKAFHGWPDGVISPIWTNENQIDVTTTPTRPGRRARVSWRPRVAGYRIASTVRTVRRGGRTDVQISSPADGVIQLTGTIAAGARPVLRGWHIADPAAFARTAFIQSLRRAGVTVTAPLTGPNPRRLLPRGRYRHANRLGAYVSAPLSQFVKVILNVSYNRGADLMVCLAAVHAGSRDCERGLASVRANNLSLGVSRNGTYAFDGAGSDDHDQTTPADVTTFLRNVADRGYGAAFRAGLPILGRTGTMATVEPHSPAAGHAQLKDGTRATGSPVTGQNLLIANTLGGYVTARSGRQLTIAVLVNNVPFTTLHAAHAVADDEGAIAAAIQQGY